MTAQDWNLGSLSQEAETLAIAISNIMKTLPRDGELGV